MTEANLIEKLSFYLVADPAQTSRDIIDDVAAALKGGISTVQLRAKTVSDREALALAERIRPLCTSADAMFLVNDRVDLALAARADGVHLGVDDLPIEAARQLGGTDFVIGFSPETDKQAAEARTHGANYLGVGPVYGTLSKSDAGAAIGLDLLARRAELAGIPIIGIGGINDRNAGDVIRAGAVGAAVIGAILRANDPEHASRLFRASIDESLKERR